MSLQVLWFCLIAVLWAGYFLLEGFDFGVGMLLPFVPRNERERGVLFDAIGPVWDGNEVWLVVAAGATFAAFPTWYATMFSGLYVPLLLLLVCLIVRVVSFEWRAKSENPRWRATWLGANVLGSIGAPFIWGVALANLLHGIPLDSSGDFAGSFSDLFSAYTVFAGIAMVLLFAFHGATFLTLRTEGELGERAAGAAGKLAIPGALAVIVFLIWTVVVAHDQNDKAVLYPGIVAAAGIVAIALALAFTRVRRSGRAFVATALATVLTVATLFTGLYPSVIVSSSSAGSLTVSAAASAHYTLAVITVVALVVTPIVILYQAWTYHVFRARLTGEDVAPPTKLVARHTGEPPAG